MPVWRAKLGTAEAIRGNARISSKTSVQARTRLSFTKRSPLSRPVGRHAVSGTELSCWFSNFPEEDLSHRGQTRNQAKQGVAGRESSCLLGRRPTVERGEVLRPG